jgi:hypothetical protein
MPCIFYRHRESSSEKVNYDTKKGIKMNIRKLQLAIMAAGLAGAMAAPNLFAYTGLDGVINFGPPTYQNGDGGEFNAIASGLGSFTTFCLEAQEDIHYPPSGPYTYTINTGAVEGGGPAHGANAIDPHTGLPMDNISIGTAWLFSQFTAATLTLDNGTGTYFDANRLANAGELQNAIWFLENEVGGQDNGYVALAQTALGGLTLAQVEADSNGAYGVKALNLFTPDYSNTLAQDVLVVVPEPTTVGCFLLGLGALVCSRRFRKGSV